MIGRIAALGSALLRVRKDSGNKKESNNWKTDLPPTALTMPRPRGKLSS